VPGDIPTSEVPTKVGSSETRKFDRPNKKPYSNLVFWISIRIISNSWETCKIRLGEVFYWDKTTPLYIYERIMAD
jgi:hypothetical protein